MNKSRETQLGTLPVGKLMLKLALPSVVAQIINLLYNLVDRMYIGRIPKVGSLALTGVGVTFPILMLISAFSAFAGGGGAPLAAIQLGRSDKKHAEQILGNSTFLLLCFSLILTVVFQLFKTPMLYLFGASDNTIGYALDYITIYLFGSIFVQLALGLNMFITSQGEAKTAMLSVLIGAVLNIVLDPVFIFLLEMGVKGAALATVISQAVSALWVLRFLTGKKTAIRIHLNYLKPKAAILKNTAALGISPFIMQATESAISIVLNNGLQTYGGDIYVGSMTVLQSVMQLISIPAMGFTQGVQPIISYNYGAGLFDRVKKAAKLTIGISFSVIFLVSFSAVLIPGFYAGLFTVDAALTALIKQVLPVYICGMLIFGLQTGCQSIFVGLGQAKISLFIALLRKVFLLIPLALILPRFMGVMGIYYAEPTADFISAATATILFLLNFRKFLSHDMLERISS